MAFEVKYRAELETLKFNQVRIDILEDATIADITYLTVGAVTLKSPDGRLDKFTGVRQSELDIEVFVPEGLDVNDFLTTSDIQYRVNMYVNDVLNWTGWLDSNGYKYQLKDYNYLINLNAKDGLHLLENAKFEPGADLEFFGQYSLTQYIFSCLKATSLINSSTDYTAYNTWINIYPDGFPVRGAGGDTTGDNDPLNNIYIDSGAFRTGVNEYSNPYIILNKICESFKMTLFQAGGEWHLVYVEDWIRNAGLTGTKWDYQNDSVSYSSNVFSDIEVGRLKPFKLINNDANVSFTSPYSKARLDIAYDVPVAKIQNQDFSKVDESTEVIDGTNGYQYYDMRDWNISAGANSGLVNIMQYRFSDSNPLANGERWAQFRDTEAGTGVIKITSNNSLVAFGDAFNLKFETGFTNSSARGNSTLVLRVKVTDGVNTRWMKVDGNWSTTETIAKDCLNTAEPTAFNLSQPKTIEVFSNAPIPLDGNLTVEFSVGHLSGTINYTIFVKKIEFDYKAVLGYNGRIDQIGRRRPLAGGQYYESKEDIKTKNIYSGDMYLFNAPQESISGAMLDSSLDLIQLWYHAGVTEEIPFGRLITNGVWKGVYRNFINLEGTIDRAISGDQFLTHLNRLKFDEFPNKIFMLTFLSVDVNDERIEFSAVELLDDTNTDDFDELATTRKTGYISDLGGKLLNNYDPYNLRDPSDYAFGQLGFLLDGIFKSKRRR